MQRDEPARLVNRWENQGNSEWTGRQLPGMAHRCGRKCQIGPDGNFTGSGGSQSVSQSKLLEGNSDYEGFSAVAAIAKSSSSSSSSSAATSKTSVNHEVKPVTGPVDAGRRSENSFELPGN